MADYRSLIETAAARASPRRSTRVQGTRESSSAPQCETKQHEADVNAPYGLSRPERNWAAIEKPLERGGYRLRPRYRSGWVGSWVGTRKKAALCEDSIEIGRVGRIMDAVRTSDGTQVLLKMWKNNERDGPELATLLYFNHPSRASDPCNHCVPLLGTFYLRGAESAFTVMLVQPLLRDWRYPPFLMVAEALSFMLQVIEGLEYMHEHGISHGDIHSGNIMMDPKGLFPKGFHGAFNWSFRARELEGRNPRRTRLQVPVKYYYIDFGSSVKLERPGIDLVVPGWTLWQSPEMAAGPDHPYDPFKADVHALGLTLLTEIKKRTGLEFVIPTLVGMISESPDERPTITEVKLAFKSLLAGLTPGQMRNRIGWPKSDWRSEPLLDWAEYIKLLWHSYWYGLPKDILPE